MKRRSAFFACMIVDPEASSIKDNHGEETELPELKKEELVVDWKTSWDANVRILNCQINTIFILREVVKQGVLSV